MTIAETIAATIVLVGIVILCYFMYHRNGGSEQNSTEISFKAMEADYVPPCPSDGPVYIFIDVETTGLSPKEDAIVQLSAFRYFGEEAVDGINTYINPDRSIPPRATGIHGITDAMVRYAPRISQVKRPFLDLIEGAVLIGHNAKFDLNFLDSAFDGELDGVKYVDTLTFSRYMLDLPNYRLETVATHLGFQSKAGFHDSLVDCQATATVFFGLGLQKEAESPETYCSKIREKNTHSEYAHQEYSEYWPAGFTAQTYKDWSNADRVRIDGDIETALSMFDKIKKSGCKAPWLYESYAKAYRKLKNYEREIEIVDEAIHECGGVMTDIFEARKKKAAELIQSRERKEEELRLRALKKEQRAERRRLEEELAKSKPKKPVGRPVAQCSDDGTIIKVFDSVTAAAKEIGVDTKGIRNAANGIQKHSGGFCWKYVDADTETSENIIPME